MNFSCVISSLTSPLSTLVFSVLGIALSAFGLWFSYKSYDRVGVLENRIFAVKVLSKKIIPYLEDSIAFINREINKERKIATNIGKKEEGKENSDSDSSNDMHKIKDNIIEKSNEIEKKIKFFKKRIESNDLLKTYFGVGKNDIENKENEKKADLLNEVDELISYISSEKLKKDLVVGDFAAHIKTKMGSILSEVKEIHDMEDSLNV